MTPRILIVDDEPSNLATLEAFLADEGYELHLAEDGQAACALARALQPDLILLDVMMPDMDGFQVCRALRGDAMIGRVPIILITALDDDRSRLEGLRAGADDFVIKPCRREELRARVRTVVSLNRFRAIAEQRERFQRLYEMAPVGIVLTDDRGVVLAANPRAESGLNVPSGRPLVEDSIFSRFDPTGAELLRDMIAAVWRNEAVPVRELRRGEDSAERILHARATMVREGGDHVTMLVFNDVTAAVRAREALEKMNARLETAVRARTAELEEANALLMSYASFVSHDLRSPLTVVKGYLSMIQEGAVSVSDEVAPLIDHAYQAAVMMQELLENILQLARDEHAGRPSGPVPCVDPEPIVRRLVGHVCNLYPQLKPRFEIGKLPRVGISPIVLERVFYNLVANALKYSADNPSPVVEIGHREDPDGPVLYVRDHGVGFDARDADKLFREFSRLPDAGGKDGFGLGLSLVSRLLRLHSARIWAEGAVGKGATFYMQFPPPSAPVAEVAAAAASA